MLHSGRLDRAQHHALTTGKAGAWAPSKTQIPIGEAEPQPIRPEEPESSRALRKNRQLALQGEDQVFGVQL